MLIMNDDVIGYRYDGEEFCPDCWAEGPQQIPAEDRPPMTADMIILAPEPSDAVGHIFCDKCSIEIW